MSKIIRKVNVTSSLRDWEESKLEDIFLKPDKVQIISAVTYEGGLYLIYTFDEEDFKTEVV